MINNKQKLLIISLTLFFIAVSSCFCNAMNSDYEIVTNQNLGSSQILQEKDDIPIIYTPSNGEDDAGSGGDAGNSLFLATDIVPGEYNGTLTDDDKDYYRFYVTAGTIINATMLAYNLSLNFDLTLYTPEFQPITNFKDAGIRETIIWSTQTSENFTISIDAEVSDDEGNYSFALNLNSQNDFNLGTDAGNTPTESLLVEEGSSNGTFVDVSDISDFYKISLEKGQVITIFIESTSTTNIDLTLFDSESQEVDSSNNIVGFDETIYYAISESGIYNIYVQFIESTISEIIIYYNISISTYTQNDGNSGTDAGNNALDAYSIIPLRNSIFKGRLIWNGDRYDFYEFEVDVTSQLIAYLIVPAFINFDLKIFDSENFLYNSSTQESEGASETILDYSLPNGTYYIAVEFATESSTLAEGDYTLNIGLLPLPETNNKQWDWADLTMKIISYGVFPVFIIIIIILVLYLFTDVKIPLLTKWLDRYFSKEGKADSAKSLKYALRVRDDQISTLREELIEKDGKRAKDLETIHRLEEDQKSNDTVLGKMREENIGLKTQLGNLQGVNEDLANIIDSTIRRQLAKSSKPTQKAKVSQITSLIWLSEERLIAYIQSVPLLNERYILDKNKSFILTRDHAREIVRQAYWKRVGAMHLKKIKQVKVSSLTEDTNIDIDTLKDILRDLVERKEIPAPIHMDRISLLLSISEELIAELTDVAQNTPIISLNEISKSYDTSKESARKIFEKIAEEGYANGEFISEDIFIVYNLFADLIVSKGSTNITKLASERNLSDQEENIRILIEKLIQEETLTGEFMSENLFLCYNNLTDPLRELVQTSIADITKGDTRKVVFDIGSVVESIIKERLIIDIHELEDVSKIPQYQEVIESKELGRILRAAEDLRITLPSNIELKSLNRFWAQKIKHTKPGELPYIPNIDQAQEFLFEANRALNRLLAQKIPTKWKKSIASKLLKDKK
ncbi:MAG: hypothetical protein FK733_10710 [Asgard group archaeon]|nr:hypothetical protein [Asgard group archaeon]